MREYQVIFKDKDRHPIHIKPELMESLMNSVYKSTPSPIAIGYDHNKDEYIVLNMNDVLHITLVQFDV